MEPWLKEPVAYHVTQVVALNWIGPSSSLLLTLPGSDSLRCHTRVFPSPAWEYLRLNLGPFPCKAMLNHRAMGLPISFFPLLKGLVSETFQWHYFGMNKNGHVFPNFIVVFFCSLGSSPMGNPEEPSGYELWQAQSLSSLLLRERHHAKGKWFALTLNTLVTWDQCGCKRTCSLAPGWMAFKDSPSSCCISALGKKTADPAFMALFQTITL